MEKYKETNTFDSDRVMTLLGVEGRLLRRTTCARTKVGCWEHQDWSATRSGVKLGDQKYQVMVKISFDDDCHNGRSFFHIIGDAIEEGKSERSRDEMGGCIHKEIAIAFPELKSLIKWHGMATDGPSAYLANTTYHAGDKDYNGLNKGEKRQLVNGRTKDPVWSLRADATGCSLKTELKPEDDITNLPIYRLQDMLDSAEMPTSVPRLFWEPTWKVGEGKERELSHARSSAKWPEATDEQLCLPAAELTALLEARLPALIAEFRTDVERIGFFWSPEDFKA